MGRGEWKLRLALAKTMLKLLSLRKELPTSTELLPVQCSKGLTLVELIVVVAIMGILASVASISYSRYINKARMNDVVSEIHEIERSILIYKSVTGDLPPTLATIGMDNLKDKWGNPFQYLRIQDAKNKGKVRRDRFNNPLNTDFDLYSMGPDGRTQMELNAHFARDDIVRANNGEYVGIASEY